jgi:hypothetical protein
MTAVTRKPLLINYLCDLNVGRSNMYVQTCARRVNSYTACIISVMSGPLIFVFSLSKPKSSIW